MTMFDSTLKTATVLVAVSAFAVAGYAAFKAAGPFVGIMYAAVDRDRIDHETYVRPAQEDTFATVCLSYRDASFWKRWTDSHFRSLSWCGDYLDRL